MELIHYYEDLNTLHVGTEKPRCYYIPKRQMEQIHTVC